VDEFLPPYRAHLPLDPTKPSNHGPQIYADQGPAIDLQRGQAMLDTPKVVEKAIEEYNKIMGRNYSPWLEEYKTDGADYVFFLQGAHCRTARFAVDHLRKKGAKVGMVKLRFVRPWPTDKVAEVLSKFKAVGVIESSTSYGGCMKGGKLMEEVRASLYDSPVRPAVTSFMAGLGGEVVSLDEFYNMAKILDTAAKKGKVDQYVYWVGFDNGI
jgi:pyruvate ferredoxin oxidoreductase alpha subunit/oxalate oxidoreductase subunit alpha